MPPVVPPTVRIKVCGIRNVDHAATAVAAGVDAIGLMFYPKSPRLIDVEQARKIAQSLPAMVSAVAVFANPTQAEVAQVCDQVPVDLLQFHGDESAQFCESFRRPYIKGVRMRTREALREAKAEHPHCRGFLVDAYDPAEMGGTGHRIDWHQLRADLDTDAIDAAEQGLILAGGLTPDNVADAISAVGPFAVDVSSGVELQPGEKSVDLIRAFARAVRS